MGVCHIIPLGGLGEVGKNMTAYEADGSIVIVDAGRAKAAHHPVRQEFAMKSSARNQLCGKVSRLATGGVNDEVEIELAGGQRIVAVVTHESAAGLGLAIGVEAFALIKASSVIVVADLETARLSARNQFSGTVTRLQPGAVNAEVVIDVGGAMSIAAIVTQQSASSLGLAPGTAVTAIFDASSVIVGVPK